MMIQIKEYQGKLISKIGYYMIIATLWLVILYILFSPIDKLLIDAFQEPFIMVPAIIGILFYGMGYLSKRLKSTNKNI